MGCFGRRRVSQVAVSQYLRNPLLYTNEVKLQLIYKKTLVLIYLPISPTVLFISEFLFIHRQTV